jgi:putative inorganic carbon (HCO3(-)) transporter
MAIRATWRPPGYAWVLLGCAALAAVPTLAPAKLQGHWVVITPIVIALGVLAVRKLWELPPALTACGAIALTIFSGGWSRMGLGGLPFDRLLLVVVLLMFFLRAPGVAHSPRLQIKPLHLLLGLTILYIVGSAAVAGTLGVEVSMLGLIDRVGIAPYLLFLVAPAVFSGERERNMLLVTLVGLGAYLGLTAIFESLGPHSLVFPHYIVQADLELRGERAGGPFQSSVSDGSANFACAVAALIAFTKWQGLRRRYFAAAVSVICLFGCFLTLERGVWIAAVVAAVVAAAVTRQGRRWIVPGLLASALLVGGGLTLSSGLASKTSSRVSDELSVWDRENQTQAGLRMFEAKPLLGFGWNRYESDSPEYFRQSPNYPLTGISTPQQLRPLHESYLSYLVEIGLVGTVLVLGSLIWGIGEGVLSPGGAELRPWKLGLLAVGTFVLVVGIFNPYEAPFPVLLLWAWVGVAFGTPARRWRTKPQPQPVRSELAWAAV